MRERWDEKSWRDGYQRWYIDCAGRTNSVQVYCRDSVDISLSTAVLAYRIARTLNPLSSRPYPYTSRGVLYLLYCIIFYYIILYCIYRTVLYCTMLYKWGEEGHRS
jgi:hypothetical protein